MLKDVGQVCAWSSRTWSELRSVGVNVSFCVEYDAFTNCVDESFVQFYLTNCDWLIPH